MISIDALERFISRIPANVTRCGDTSDYISACLSKPNFDGEDYYSPDWITHRTFNPSADIVTVIEETVLKWGYVSLSISCGEICSNLEHSFNICSTEEGYIIIDSYIDTRRCSLRPFDFELFKLFIRTPSIDLWNQLWLCKENNSHTGDSPMIVDFIEYMYHDPKTII
jgi:hypothetical protein